ncbi:MAG: hypothetical protein AAFV90_04930 [Cyanobacteria bacterium J06634_5]
MAHWFNTASPCKADIHYMLFLLRLTQLDKYLSGLSLNQGWLVIFDSRSHAKPLAERTTTDQTTTPEGRTVAVIRR